MYKFKADMYADIRIEDRYNTIVAYVNGSLQELKERNEKRAFIRVFDGKMWYYSSTTDISRVQEKLDELYAQGKSNPKILSNKIREQLDTNHSRI